MTAQVLRFFPEYMALREVIADGKLGRVRFAWFRRSCAAPALGRMASGCRTRAAAAYSIC